MEELLQELNSLVHNEFTITDGLQGHTLYIDSVEYQANYTEGELILYLKSLITATTLSQQSIYR